MATEAKVYRVWHDYSGGKRVRLTTAQVEVRAKSVRFPEYSAAFSCHTVVPLEDVRFNRDDAITQYVNGNLKEIDGLRRKISRLEREIDAARTLTEDEPVAVVKDGESE